MSRIGKQPIIIPEGVEVKFENGEVVVKGPKGELKQAVLSQMDLSFSDTEEGDKKIKSLQIVPKRTTKNSSAFWGLTRALIANMVKGVTEGFEKKLEIEGVGYRASLEGTKLVLSLGLSHPINMEAPDGITFVVEKNVITVAGFDKQKVGQVAAKIRDYKKPEPYKGKGIHYVGEVVRRKAGKKTVAGE
ncbi:MAG: 50S ribosomal protein L6 [bacterium]